jgi:hypothetical protein
MSECGIRKFGKIGVPILEVVLLTDDWMEGGEYGEYGE